MRNSHRKRHVGLREILALSQMSISRVDLIRLSPHSLANAGTGQS